MLRAGAGSPLVLIHGINASGRVWQPVLEALQAEHEVYVPTLLGHRGGAAHVPGTAVGLHTIADALEAELSAQGVDTAHIVGNSLGGWLALELGRRGRARSVVALSPAGAWLTARDLRRLVLLLSTGRRTVLRHRTRLEPLLRRARFRRLALRLAFEHGHRLPAAAVADMIEDLAACTAFDDFAAWVRTTQPFQRASAAQDYPIRVGWGEHDRTLPFARYGRPLLDALPGAEHVSLPGVGHVPMYDDPALVVRTILEITRSIDHDRSQAMTSQTTLELDGTRGRIALHRWEDGDVRFIVLLAHGYGEHAGRYAHVAERLVAEGAAVYAPDHLGHGRSAGERALIEDFEDVLSDFEAVERLARSEHPDLPVVLIGHSMGGVIATRYVQTRSPDLRALVLSGPVIGGNSAIEGLLGMDPIPEIPIDPAVLSRDEAVGQAYADDELVYHGAFKRPTLEALFGAIRAIADGPGLNSLPLLWIHGEEDALAPLAETRPVVERIRGESFEERVYPEARHEVFNETNRAEVIDDVVAFVNRALAS